MILRLLVPFLVLFLITLAYCPNAAVGHSENPQVEHDHPPAEGQNHQLVVFAALSVAALMVAVWGLRSPHHTKTTGKMERVTEQFYQKARIAFLGFLALAAALYAWQGFAALVLLLVIATGCFFFITYLTTKTQKTT